MSSESAKKNAKDYLSPSSEAKVTWSAYKVVFSAYIEFVCGIGISNFDPSFL